MKDIKEVRKKMNIPQRELAEHLKVTLKTYILWEKTDCKKKKKILTFLTNYKYKDRFLGLGVSRLAKSLGLNVGNLSVYIRSGRHIEGLNEVLKEREKEVAGLRLDCMRLFVKYSEK